MDSSFHALNRKKAAASMAEASCAVIFSGVQKRRTADESYGFYADRDFLYLTGLKNEGLILLLVKKNGGTSEKLYLAPPDMLKERWTGRRVRAEEAETLSGVRSFAYSGDFNAEFDALLKSGINTVYLDLDPLGKNEHELPVNVFSRYLAEKYPAVERADLRPTLGALRAIKTPAEIDAMRTAEELTGAGILRLMRTVKPGMYEYELKAAYDFELARRGTDTFAFPPIISAGANNFCIHYYDYGGTANDGDLVLNDVGASWDGHGTDVSRAYPVNGKFTERQKLLFDCAYATSEHTFSMIKPGQPMSFVDDENRRFCAERLVDIGLLGDAAEVGRYMWHGGAHHVGYDTHDAVGHVKTIEAGMVFCVDIGIYVEEWGIGFRLEDNCHVTADGAENLSAKIPRTTEDIENAMKY